MTEGGEHRDFFKRKMGVGETVAAYLISSLLSVSSLVHCILCFF
jgi:hypothetical protein